MDGTTSDASHQCCKCSLKLVPTTPRMNSRVKIKAVNASHAITTIAVVPVSSLVIVVIPKQIVAFTTQ